MKKVMTKIISAIAFGIIAGVVMLLVNFAAKDLNILQQPTHKTVIEESKEVENNDKAILEETKQNKILRENANNYSYTEVSDLVDDTMPSVVAITNMQKFTQNGFSIFGYRQQARQYEAPASGSGVIVGMNDDEVIIITNNHVVTDSSSLSVTFNESETVDAAIKGVDTTKDLAIVSVPKENIKKEVLEKLRVIVLGNSDDIKVGEGVVAIGNALGIGQSVTTGVVSAKDRIVDDINNTEKLIQTDAAINPGNSGGALLNMKGELIGINVAKTSGTAIEGMGYAIPVNTAQGVIETLSNKKAREEIPEEEQGYLGITARNIDQDTARSLDMPEGIYIYKITENSAAANSDLKEKDIIVAFDDQNIKTLSELQDLLKYTRSGEEVQIKVKRINGGVYEEKEMKVTLGKRPVEDKKENNNSNQASEEQTKERENTQRDNNNNGRYGQYNDFDDIFREFFMW